MLNKHLAKPITCIYVLTLTSSDEVDTATFLQMKKWRQEDLSKLPKVIQQGLQGNKDLVLSCLTSEPTALNYCSLRPPSDLPWDILLSS